MEERNRKMKSYVDKINRATAENDNFRKVLFTSDLSQLVVMRLKTGEEIAAEVHHNIDQFIRVESGEGTAVLNGENHELKPGYAVVIPAGVEHNVINTSSDKDLKRYTIYTPPEHPEGTIHRTKAAADAAEH
jgi:mannose-6-phosphate isomerase-like protein (cupin superfamily)